MLARVFQRAFLLAAAAISFASPLHAQDGPAKALAPQGAVVQDAFLNTLKRSYETLTSPDVPETVKSQEVDGLFKQAGALCADNCEGTIGKLRWLNEQVHSGAVDKLFGQLPEGVREQVPVKPEDLAKLTSALDTIVRKANPEMIRHQAQTALEVLRYVVSIEEKNLFNLNARDEAAQAEAKAALKRDLETFHKQGRAMMDLVDVAKNINKPGGDQKELAQRLAKDLDDLGLFFLKFAQSLSNMNALPPAITEGLRGYQDDVKAMPPEDVERIMAEEFGPEWRGKFVEFDAAKPLKSGTVAQTYKAKIKTLFGVKVVIVKVQRPGLAEQLDWNRRVNKIVTKSAEAAVPEKWAWTVDIFAGSINGLEDAFQSELDFKEEAENMSWFRNQFAMSRGVYVPKSFEDFSTSRVLTMEIVPGENIERLLERSDAANGGQPDVALRVKLFSNLLDAFVYQLVTVGNMHADLHPGNILATEEGELGLIDWGQVFETRGMVTAPVKAAFAVLTGDSKGFTEHFLEMGRMPEAKLPAFQALVDATFKEKGLSLWKMRALMGTKRTDYGKGFIEAFKVLIPAAFKDHGFRASPQYLQFFRSAAPVAASLAKIGKGVPQEQLIEILKAKALMFAPDSVTRQIGAKALNAVDWASAPVQNCAKSALARVRRMVGR
jgi:predicted unusual protein kinase regulating ubiquinone biosynthesis (AarF/ABC1/UbiB family)